MWGTGARTVTPNGRTRGSLARMTNTGRELLVLRHAKSAWDTAAPSDFDRPLSKRGRKDAPRVAAWLVEEGFVPDCVRASTAARVRETLDRMSSVIDLPLEDVSWDDDLYHASPRTMLEALAGCPDDARRVLLVGHNPGVEDLVLHLSRAPVHLPPNGKIMPTCAVAHFRMPEDWSALRRGDGELTHVLRPRTLRST